MLLQRIAFLAALGWSVGVACQENTAADHAVRSDMQRVYTSFKQLHTYLFDRESFESPANTEIISKLLREISAGFNHAGTAGAKTRQDPGFESILKITTDLIEDSKNRFNAGNKPYALWRLRTAANNCVSCHSRFEVPADFSDASLKLDNLNPYQRGEFLMATRQFEKARPEFRNAVLSNNLSEIEKFKALRNWLVLAVRVKPEPLKAVTELQEIRKNASLLPSEQYEIDDWISSLQAWAESGPDHSDTLKQAERLIRQSTSFDDVFSPKRGNVEMLRATAFLHQYLESRGAKGNVKDRAQALYLLGLAYSELPLFFVDGLAESFLEQCIRENPNTPEARKAFRLLIKTLTLTFTGSGGTNIPDDERSRLAELDRISRGIPEAPSRI